MPLKLRDLFKIVDTVENVIIWLFNLGLILDLSGRKCDFCKIGNFGLRKDQTFSKDNSYWKCSNKKCGKKVSLRSNSWFSNSNLSLENIILITYFWVYRSSEDFVIHELGISNKTIVDWYNFCREVCETILESDRKQIGGVGHIVEIDESKLGKRKYHRGKRVDGVWVFGGIDRETKDCFFKCVENRTAETLVKIIKDNIKPGTTIISDCWKAYSSLKDEGFQHLTVNHSIEFKNEETGACTNMIESTWRALKNFLPPSSTTKTLYDSYFSQYCVRKKYLTGATDPFLEFLSLIKKVYSPKFEPSQEEIENFNKNKAEKSKTDMKQSKQEGQEALNRSPEYTGQKSNI